MNLDRNIDGNAGRGKYALILLRKLQDFERVDRPFVRFPSDIASALDTLEKYGLIDWGLAGSDSEFFLMRLKDRHAEAGLNGYAHNADLYGDREWADEVRGLADRAGPNHPACQLPD